MGETSNVSSSGVLMKLQAQIAPGERIEYFIQLYPTVEGLEALRVYCKGRVVRWEGRLCAATIDRYKFVREVASGQTDQ